MKTECRACSWKCRGSAKGDTRQASLRPGSLWDWRAGCSAEASACSWYAQAPCSFLKGSIGFSLIPSVIVRVAPQAGTLQAAQALACAPAGHGGKPVYASVVSPDSRWLPGQLSIARMGSLAAYLGSSGGTGQVGGFSHALALLPRSPEVEGMPVCSGTSSASCAGSHEAGTYSCAAGVL